MSLASMGRDLRARRRALGLTQADVAAAVQTRPVLVGRWERGEAVPTLDEAGRLAEVLDLDPGVAAGWSAVALRPETGAPPLEEADAGLPAPRRWSWLRRTGVAAWWRLTASGRNEEAGSSADGTRRPWGSYLDDPVERRRYALRWALTLLVLGALAIGLVWALVELRAGWDAFLDLYRSRPPGSGLTRALPALMLR